MRSEILATVEQISPSVLGSGEEETIRQSKLGQLFVASWKERLLLSGRLWRFSVGTVAGDAGITKVTGGGAGTTVDLDEPEIAIGCATGYRLIPLEVHVSAFVDCDLEAELGEILVTMDRSQIPAGVTGTALTGYNLLDGAANYPGGLAYQEVTVVTTNPTNEEILAHELFVAREFLSSGAAAGTYTNGVISRLTLHYEPQIPSIVDGPCTLCVYWGGTAAVTALATVVVACVPTSWFPVS